MIHGVSQERTFRNAWGQQGFVACRSGCGPPVCGVGGWLRLRGVACGHVAEPGVPAEREGAVDQGLVAADGGLAADLEVGPAQFGFDLFVALLDPVADAAQAHDLGQVSR